jgi:cytosine/adenosine deaminase-related metal-dependent hydrolase
VIRYTADWVLPITDGPIRNGTVTLDRGRIVGVERARAADAIDLGRSVILPSLVNAHTHLELSYLRGVVPPAERFLDWIRALMAERRRFPDPADPAILETAQAAIDEAMASGTGLVGDVSNTLVTVPLLHDAVMPAHVFYELLGFNVADPLARVAEAREKVRQVLADISSVPSASTAGHAADVRISLAAHAPYSVAEGLFSAIREATDEDASHVSSVHLSESVDEIEFLREGSGGWRTLLQELGVWNKDWSPPGKSPVEYLSDIGFLDSRVLAVHGVQCSGEDLDRLRALDVTIVSCPRSNQYVGVGAPPLEAFYAMGVRVAFGTDSLASAPDLDMFAELAEARRLAPRVPARGLLESATLRGARALGFADELGSLEAGKRASVIAVRGVEGVEEVEEYLLSGIEPGMIRWLRE